MLPDTLIKEYNLEICDGNGNISVQTYENHLRFTTVEINTTVRSIRFIPKSTWGCKEFRMFCVEPLVLEQGNT